MASLVQQHLDVENPGGVTTGKRGQMISAGPRRGLGKVFSSSNENSLVTPRKALGDLSNSMGGRQALGNLSNTIHKTGLGGSNVLKKPLAPQLKTPGAGIRVFGDAPSLKGFESKKKGPKVKADFKKHIPIRRPSEIIPDIENMKIFKDSDTGFTKLPAEDCLSSHLDRLGPMRATLFRYPVRDVDDLNPDFSHLSLDTMLRPSQSDDDPILPVSTAAMSGLDLPSVDSIDFLDMNNLVFDDF